MKGRLIGEEILCKQAIAPAELAEGETLGTAVDRLGFLSAILVMEVGAENGTASMAVKVQESDTTTSGDFVDVSGATMTAITAAGHSELNLDLTMRKRYIRAVATITGSGTPKFFTSGTFVLGGNYKNPQ